MAKTTSRKPTDAQLAALKLLAKPGVTLMLSYGECILNGADTSVRSKTLEPLVEAGWVDLQIPTTRIYVLSATGTALVESSWKATGIDATVAQYRERILAAEKARVEAAEAKLRSADVDVKVVAGYKPRWNIEPFDPLQHILTVGCAPTLTVKVDESIDYQTDKWMVRINVDTRGGVAPADMMHLTNLLERARVIAEQRQAVIDALEVTRG